MSTVARGARSATQRISNVAGDVVLNRDPPSGFLAAAAVTVAHAPTLGEIRQGSLDSNGKKRGKGSGDDSLNANGQGTSGSSKNGRKGTMASRERSEDELDQSRAVQMFAPLTEEPPKIGTNDGDTSQDPVLKVELSEEADTGREPNDPDMTVKKSNQQRVYSSGYIPPPKVPWTTSSLIALRAFWNFFTTPFGFFVTIYGLNVVAWGGMLFLLLCNASQAMCWSPVLPAGVDKTHASDGSLRSPAAALALRSKGYPTYFNCNDINSPRRIWIEIDSQILNALFCVTGLGLIPWRFRDLHHLLSWRLEGSSHRSKTGGLRKLAGIHRGWFRLPDSHSVDDVTSEEYLASHDICTTLDRTVSTKQPNDLEAANLQTIDRLEEEDPRIPLPVSKKIDDPITGVRAPPTALWKLDFFVWSQVWNTFFQLCLCGFMWGMNRYDRPPWSTGLFVALACIIAGAGGYMSFVEGKKIKRVEGVTPKYLAADEEEGASGLDLEQTRTQATEHESVHIGREEKDKTVER